MTASRWGSMPRGLSLSHVAKIPQYRLIYQMVFSRLLEGWKGELKKVPTMTSVLCLSANRMLGLSPVFSIFSRGHDATLERAGVSDQVPQPNRDRRYADPNKVRRTATGKHSFIRRARCSFGSFRLSFFLQRQHHPPPQIPTHSLGCIALPHS